jgi:hypothetical protein
MIVRTSKVILIVVIAGLSLAACVHVPTAPNVMALPGSGKTFEEFQYDDVTCRQWASYQVGGSPSRAANDTAVANAALGTVLGAAAGAAIGAASGRPATGAAVGAGAGLLGGSLIGASNSEEARWSMQRRYDMAYMQCMYAKGNQIPVPQSSQPSRRSARRGAPRELPPPPPGEPPPPPGYGW